MLQVMFGLQPGGLIISAGQGTISVTITAPSGFTSGSVRVSASNCISVSGLSTRNVTRLPSTPVWKTTPPSLTCAGSCYDFNIDNVQDAVSWTITAPSGCVITSPGGTPGSGNPFTTTKSIANICFPAGFLTGTVSIVANNACGQSGTLSRTVRSVPPVPAAKSSGLFSTL